ncbi:MAG: lysylphosphatidylglycerol synthase transmembrane domain-containing protein [Anaerolineae bacterium]|uniref:lysylphosphatidylglycerol synthase transmembrane domain-containing protein n=1 Tax=Candidatus Amarolinea dominans TaxID=3140696 RepID=UPI003136F886|nr:flippase-like domain-containing protein [Anaerolineae bacterium]MBK9092905.1 flippase-like domain-containing protein [Anaerolineae bacterium]MBK9230917.1 flippase-like domain-containing protein [Anaerolineae bacterium]
MRDKLTALLKLVVSAALIAFIFSRADLAALGARLAGANGLLVLLALIAYFGAIVMNTAKWAVLLRAQVPGVPFGALLRYTFIGVFFNNILPANIGGDVMRGYGLSAYTESKLDAAASVIVDRLVGLMAFVSSAVVAALIAIYTTHLPDLVVVGAVAIVALAALVFAFAVLFSRRLRIVLARLFDWSLLRPLAPVYGRLADAFGAYRFRYKTLLAAYLIGMTGLMLTNAVNYLLSQALGGGISFLAIALFNPLIALVLLIPISVGGLGVNQNAYVGFYGLVGVPHDHALAVSLLIQALIIISSLPGGLLWLRGRNITR